MKNTLIAVIVIILVILGIVLLTKDKAQAPEGDTNVNVNTPAPSPTPGVGVTGSVTAGAVKEFTVRGTNFAFDPSTITVNKGDKVKITFINSEGFHDFKIDDYGLASKQANAPATEVIEFTADKTGTFEYYCSVGSHRAMGMKGTLNVK